MALILVTGATGGIGRHVVRALLRSGHSVRGQYLRSPGDEPDVDWRRWDFSGADDVGELVQGCEGVVHLAAEIARAERMFRVNVESTAALAAAGRAHGVRYFCYASSIVVYGSPGRRSIHEESPTIDPEADIQAQYPSEPYMAEYARTKMLAERKVQELFTDGVLDIIRPTIVADRQKWRESLAWSPVRQVLTRHRRTQYVDVRDVAAAIAFLVGRGLAEAGRPLPQVYNICDSSGTFRDLDRRLRKASAPATLGPPGQLMVLFEVAKEMMKSRSLTPRYPLPLLRISGAKIAKAGFTHPLGHEAAVSMVQD